MVAVDTNILLRLFTRDDERLAVQAEKALADNKTLLLDRLILAEFGYVLRSYYGYEKTDIVRMQQSLLADERFSVPDRELVERTVALFASEKPLSFEDCWLLALQRQGRVLTIITQDADLRRRVC